MYDTAVRTQKTAKLPKKQSPKKRAEIKCFVSYSSQDKRRVRKIAAALESQGICVWLDERSILPGESISDRLQAALTKHDIFLVMLSPYSVRSRWVMEELRVAFQQRIHKKAFIIPILLRACRIPPFLKDYKYVSLVSKPHLEAMNELCDAVVLSRPGMRSASALPSTARIIKNANFRIHLEGNLARFSDEQTFVPIRPTGSIRREITIDGQLKHCSLSFGTIRRTHISRGRECWFLIFPKRLPPGQPSTLRLEYTIANEFADANNYFYFIESPCRELEFSLVIGRQSAPAYVKVRQFYTQTPIRSERLRAKTTAHAKLFTFKTHFPTLGSRFEFSWPG